MSSENSERVRVGAYEILLFQAASVSYQTQNSYFCESMGGQEKCQIDISIVFQDPKIKVQSGERSVVATSFDNGSL